MTDTRPDQTPTRGDASPPEAVVSGAPARGRIAGGDLELEVGAASLRDARPLARARTRRHEVVVLGHPRLGRLLTVDGALVDPEEDPARREMLAHVPVLGRERERCRALLLGADLALVRELLRHDHVERVLVLDEDPLLLRACAEALELASLLTDPRVESRGGPLVKSLLASTGEAPFDLAFAAALELRRPSPAGTSLAGLRDAVAARLAPSGALVDADAVVLGVRERRWLREAAGAGESLRAACAAGGRLRRCERLVTPTSIGPGAFVGISLWTEDGASFREPRGRAFEGLHYDAALHRASFRLPSFMGDLP